MPLVGMVEVPVSGMTGEHATISPARGERRIVKIVETPFGWAPAVWTSPYTVYDPDLKEPCKVCVVLVGKGPPKPELVIMTIPAAILARYPEDAVEW